MSATQQTEAKKKFTYTATAVKCKKCGRVIVLEQDTNDKIELFCQCGYNKFKLQEK